MIAIDLFAGAGGWSTGALRAGLTVAAAINHCPIAVASHLANHPETLHLCQDAGLADPRTYPRHDVLLASPACQGHSRARGTDKPHHDLSSATAWCVVNTADICRPRFLAVENVPEFREWPLYPAWRAALELLGYHLSEVELEAAECGLPQERRRLFVLGSLAAAPVVVSPRMEPQPASSFVDFSAGKWAPVAGHCSRTLRRISTAQAEHGPRVLIPYYSSARGGRPLSRPVGTITTRDRFAVVDGDRMRMLSVAELKAAMGFGPGYILTGNRADQVRQLGNAVPPPMAETALRQMLAVA